MTVSAVPNSIIDASGYTVAAVVLAGVGTSITVVWDATNTIWLQI